MNRKGISCNRICVIIWLLLISVKSISVKAINFKESNGGDSTSCLTDGINQIKFKPYYGVNYWYGGFACVDSVDGVKRVRKELDFLKKNGVTMLRVFITADGDSSYPYRVYPSIQNFPRNYNNEIMKGFDRFLVEVERREMQVIFVLSNNWEWTGGFGQYVDWSKSSQLNSNHSDRNNSQLNAPLPKTSNWDWGKYCEYVGSFYSDSMALEWYWDFVRFVVQRKNEVDGKKYSEHPAIFSWQLANEPRPMIKSEVENYVLWIKKSSELIRCLDSKHLISIGVEGKIGMFNDMGLFRRIHSFSQIDYATIHLWPKTWNWYQGNPSEVFSADCLNQISNYIQEHAEICEELGKPLVIEEFGLERDANYALEYSSIEFQKSRFSNRTKTQWRDGFYALVYNLGNQNKIKGYNFWGYAGLEENINLSYFMKPKMQYSADPPQEEQGLYSVYRSDKSTWKVIRRFSKYNLK